MLTAELARLPLADIGAAVATAVILAGIIAIHILYFAAHRGVSSQQQFELRDFSGLSEPGWSPGELTIVHGERQQFDAVQRRVSDGATGLALAPPPLAAPCQRFRDAVSLAGTSVAGGLICDDDLVIGGSAIFLGPVKVAGDLLIDGDAIFHWPVTVNGLLKVSGTAHFASGIVAKGDALIHGSLHIGSDPSTRRMGPLPAMCRSKRRGSRSRGCRGLQSGANHSSASVEQMKSK